MEQKPLAIISGGTGYLGAAIVTELESTGWRTISLARSVTEDTDSVYQCDVTNEKDVHTVIAQIIADHGPVTACIHSASPMLERVPILSVSAESFDVAMDTGARAAFLLAKELSGHMSKDAAFIGITTQTIEPGTPQPSGAYIPAKYALRGFLRVLTSETKQEGIRVYAVSPHFLPGGLNSDLPQPVQDFLAHKSGTDSESPKEIATLIRKLCVGETEFLPGSSITFPSLTASPL
jgi:NAD(P)-dependent dehydrogenase (short-subunit alcohol dehydrogenase family)